MKSKEALAEEYASYHEGRDADLLYIAYLAGYEAVEKNSPQWVSVEEGLPEEGAECAVLSSEFNDRALDVWQGGEWTYFRDVTHWMPLPEPPKEK